MPTVDETAKVMFGMGRMNPMTMLQIFREINSLLNMFKARKSQTAVSDINFTGQHTDIALVAENGKLNAEEIEKITDNQLRENVQKSFSEAVQNGYLDYDAKARDFTVTQKGLEHINSEAFMKQFEKDRLQKLSENKAQVNLRGNGTDLNVFRFTDSIIVFWVATIAIAAGGGIPSLIKLVQGQADEDPRGRNAGIAGLVITGAVIGAAAAVKTLLF